MRRAAALTSTCLLLLSAALRFDSTSAFAAGPCCLHGGIARNPLLAPSRTTSRPTLRMGGGGGGSGAGVAEFAALLPGRVTASSEAAGAVIREAWRRDADIAGAPGAAQSHARPSKVTH